MDPKKLETLRMRLNEMHQWPSVYLFKFIIPNDEQKLTDLKLIFDESAEFSIKESRNGNYVSLSVKEMMLDADSIFDRYTKATAIEGIISL